MADTKTKPKTTPKAESKTEPKAEPKPKTPKKVGYKVTFRNGKTAVIYSKAVYESYERKSKDPKSYVKTCDGVA